MNRELQMATDFLVRLFNALSRFSVDVSRSPLDHLCYRVSTLEEYARVKQELSGSADLLHEAQISGRPIATFLLHKPIRYQAPGESAAREIRCIEVPAPKASKPCATGWEHAEFVIEESFEDFERRYPDLTFDRSGVAKANNPELELSLGEGIAVKFHHAPLEEIVRLEKGN